MVCCEMIVGQRSSTGWVSQCLKYYMDLLIYGLSLSYHNFCEEESPIISGLLAKKHWPLFFFDPMSGVGWVWPDW